MKAKLVILLAAMFATILSARALGPFAEDFESTLAQWTGRGGGGHNGLIVPDPLNSGRGNVLTFTAITGGSDVFASMPISLTGTVAVSFDYLGLPSLGGVPGDLGGFLGISFTLTPIAEGVDHYWLAGTQEAYPGLAVALADDGDWRRYSFQLDADALPAFHLMLEDFIGSGGVPQDVFFDNISVAPVPEPTAAVLLCLGLTAWAARRRRP